MPRFIQWLYPERIWAFSRSKNLVYLTFDDGPIPEITPWILDELKKHNAKATFFCIGENVQKHPKIYQKIILNGHTVGNHTFNHLKGTKTATTEYIENTLLAEKLIDSSLFRPPYGKITQKQAKILQQKGFKIVIWDIISYDYDAAISEEQCLQNVLKNIKPGSVIVFHDSLKAEKNLRYVLPKVLEFIIEKGWKCLPILN
jgi:peptidoglycan/xylan/chitin deacetylase (PgdA/CDA1 family)